ncbi:MAG TPA: rod shape-determining protein RodA [Acidimicrobiia bacterium]|nr:rod shape-determining protein RodA [Acidimicrobiia bacterium]
MTVSSVPTRRHNPIVFADWILVGASLLLSIIGLVMVYSSTQHRLAFQGEDANYFLVRQASFLVLGLALMALMIYVDYRVLRDLSPVIYAAAIGVLFLVLSPLGTATRGAQARFDLGLLQFQPSEISKIVLILAVASFCYQYRGDLDAWRLAQALGMAAVPMGLILLQPDLGTAIVIAATLLGILLVAGARPRHLGVILLFGATSLVGVVAVGALEDYQVDRLTSFVDQSSDLQTSRYNLQQSKIAIGSGGVFGKGLGNGSQTGLSFVPEQHTDFIFTAVGEELGFVGSSLILALFGVVVWRTWRIAQLAKDPFGTLAATGVLVMIAFQVFQNVGMSMGIMPITGIPLPFLSYGGSSMLASLAGIGLVVNIGMRRYT